MARPSVRPSVLRDISPCVCLALATLALAPDHARAAFPEREWGTYLGGPAADYLPTVAVGATGHVYVCGYTASPTGIATPDAHQAVFAGIYDAILVKFTPDGEREWGTYLGGAAQDYCHGLVVDAEDRALITGYTESTEGIATPGALLDAWTDQRCSFAAQFAADGEREWGTYLPNPKSWGVPVAAIGAGGSRLIAGVALSLPFELPNAYQPAPGGSNDAYLLALSADGALVWGTYYGGAGSDGQAVALAADGPGVTLALITSSSGLATAGVHQEASGGGRDAMVVRFTSDGARVWSTYFGGPKDEGLSSFMATALAPDGGAWLVTDTNSLAGIAGPGAHQAALAGTSDLAVARFDAAGQRVWSTYLGGTSNEMAGSLVVDAAGHGLVAVATASPGLATPNALQAALAGKKDVLLTRFDPAGSRVWASYYGGTDDENVDANALAHDGLGTFYLAGTTFSKDLVATRGAHQPAHGGGGRDGLLVRLAAGFGAPCATDGECETNLCIDGVCCAKPCGGDDPGDCRACSVAAGAAVDGLCGTLAADTVCRPGAGVCDAPEVCSGDAVACPADLDAADDTPCDGGACHAGACVPEDTGSTGDASTGSTGDAGTTTGAGTTTTSPVDPTTGAAPTTTGEPPDVTTTSHAGGADESGDGGDPVDTTGGCGCNASPFSSDMSMGLLVLLALRRRRGGGRRRR